MKLPETMRVTRDGQGELYVSVSDLEDALRTAATAAQAYDQNSAHTLRLAASLLRPAVLASLRERKSGGVRFTFSGTERRLAARAITFISADLDGPHDGLDKLWRSLGAHTLQPESQDGVRPTLNEEKLTLLEHVIEYALESQAFGDEDAQLNALWRRLRGAHRSAHRSVATAGLSLVGAA